MRKQEEVDHEFIVKRIKKLLPTIRGYNSIEVFKETPSIINNVFVSMWRTYQKGTFKCQLIVSTYEEWKGYLYLTIRNEVFNTLNNIKAARNIQELTYSTESDADAFVHPSTSSHVSDLQSLLANFTPKQQELISLLMSGYKKKEIALMYGLEKNGLSTQLRRIKDKIIQIGIGKEYDNYNKKDQTTLPMLTEEDIIYKTKAIATYKLKNSWVFRRLIKDLKPIDKSKYQFEKKVIESVYWAEEFLEKWKNSKEKTT